MNTMTIALKNAGLTVPVNKRVWLWLKDHPSKTVLEIKNGLGEASDKPIYNAMHDLAARGMVSVTKVKPLRHANEPGPSLVNKYTTLGSEFELLPKRKTPPTVVAKHVASTPTPVTQKEPEKVVGKFAINIENMTLADARALYLQLKEFFG